MIEASNLIGGNWESTSESRDVTDPADESVVGRIAWGTAQDGTRAADAAASAFDSWSLSTGRTRGDLLRDAAELLAERRDSIALVLAREAGKRLPEAQGEVDFSVEYFRWFAEEARRGGGSVIPSEAAGRRHFGIHRPLGVAASLTPWNFPVSIQARKITAMLAAGCTVVARVSEKAPLAATALFEVLTHAGFPAGVVNLVHGPARELTAAMVAHPAVRAVSFTGSTAVGREIMAMASRRIVRPLLELGGNAPFIVFDDANLDDAIDGAVLGRLRNTGQSCVAANRFLVHESIIDEFGSRLAARFDALSIGNGVPTVGDAVPDLGPMIDADRVAAVQALIDDAVERGGVLLTTRSAVPADGSFLAPALVRDAPPDSALASEEVFGPAAAVTSFTDDADALAKANSTEMGLAGYIWTANGARAWAFADRLEVGILGINDPLPSVAFAPMGGVKQSGLGREGSSAGMEEFQDTRYLAWKP